MNDYTVTLTNGMRVRHDAEARFTVSSGRDVLQDDLIPAEGIGGAMTLAGFTYNRLSYSGGVHWWNPTTGATLSKRPKVRVRFRPEDVLTGEQECGCPRCEGS